MGLLCFFRGRVEVGRRGGYGITCRQQRADLLGLDSFADAAGDGLAIKLLWQLVGEALHNSQDLRGFVLHGCAGFFDHCSLGR